MTVLQTTSLLVVLAACFGAFNHLFLRLPGAIGILVVALLVSLGLMAFDMAFPWLGVAEDLRRMVEGVHFSDALLKGMLGLLLFAGALHVRLGELRAQWLPVLLMATIGVLLSTLVTGMGFSWLTGTPLLVALVFGALISPTDPVAVLGVLREARLPSTLETKIAGESLFNDGVGYVVFLVLVGLAFPEGGLGGQPGLEEAVLLFLREVIGGIALGLLLGWLSFQLMRRIDDYGLEVHITLALVLGGYELSILLHVSAPIMAVVAGLFIGHMDSSQGISEKTRNYVDSFWKLVDHILNAVLFVMIGFEVFLIVFDASLLGAGVAAIALALLARLLAVSVPVLLLHRVHDFSTGVVPIMTWGGIKGGISVALALSLPESQWTPLLLTATYVVVVFSIVVQGLTVAPLARRMGRKHEPT